MIARLLALMPTGSFLRNVSILTGSTVFAQGIMAAILPLLTRLYTPQDFGVFAVYVAVLSILIGVSNLGLNYAIPLCERDDDAINVFAAAALVSTSISLVLAALVFFWPAGLTGLMHQPDMKPYLWLFPAGLSLSSLYVILQMWATRRKHFTLVARTRLTRAVAGAAAQLLIGYLVAGPFGLMFGFMLYNGMGVIGLALKMFRDDRPLFGAVSMRSIGRVFVEHMSYPLLTTPAYFLNITALQLPVMMIAASVTGPEAGYVMLAMQVMGLPMGLVGGAVAQVYSAEAAQKLRTGELSQFTTKIMWNLLKLGAPVLIITAILAPILFPIVFGPEWTRAGYLIVWMTPWFILQFVASPISTLLYVTGNQYRAMLLQLAGLIMRAGPVMLAASHSPAWAAEVYAVSGAAFYGLYVLVLRDLARTSNVS